MNEQELPPAGNRKYPWALWTDTTVHQIIKGRDYFVLTETMRVMINTHARRIGMTVQTRKQGETLVFQFGRLK